ncbi:MAG TPA: putative Ig domain-containing protein [Thermoanaerobaculia bacterium]|nr:putative Ig domain-containing protein [Thermoanaerobaculia bacterium]
MSNSSRVPLFTLGVALMFTLGATAATTYDFKVLMDADNTASTGCSVATAEGDFPGVEQVLTTSVSVDDVTGIAKVTSVSRTVCSGGTFGAPIPVDAGGWGAGSASGLIVETYIPFAVLGNPVPMGMHLGFAVGGVDGDAILSNRGARVLFPVRTPRRRGIALHPTPSITLDGDTSDWNSFNPLAEAPSRGGLPMTLLRTFGTADNNQFFFRFDAVSNATPAPPLVALSDSYTVSRGITLNVVAPGVLANDSGGSGPLHTIFATPPSHGTLTLNSDGGFIYVNDGSVAASDFFTYRASDGRYTSGPVAVSLTITCPVVDILPATLAPGLPGTPYGPVAFTQTGGSGAIVWSLTGGALPPGMTFSPLGILSGTPAACQGGTYNFTVKATDANGCSGTQAETLSVPSSAVIKILPTTLPVAQAGAPYGPIVFSTTGGVAPITWRVSSGALPREMTFSSFGILFGTPNECGSGTFDFTVQATDANGCSGTQAETFDAPSPVTVTSPATTTGTVNTPFSQTFTATGLVATAWWNLWGNLPTGLTLAKDGTLSGIPLQTGSFPIRAQVSEPPIACTSISTTYVLTIGCQTIAVNNPATTTGAAEVAFSQTFTAANTIGTTNFLLVTGTLPAGLTLATNGTLSGTPHQTGTFPITVRAVDANGCSAVGATYALTIM